MQDRYLFKAKRIKDGQWVEGAFYIKPYTDRCYIIQWNRTGLGFNEFNEFIEVDGETICQCTGLKDKNGNLIWENDIVEYRDCTTERYVVAYENDKACFEYQQYGCSIMNFDEMSSVEVEVVGNVFDNPELLEVQECEYTTLKS